MTKNYYLVGIKGVAMTALAQVLLNAGHTVRGSDVRQSFVTTPLLERLGIQVDDFSADIPAAVTDVVYTAAHQASKHPQVQAAITRGLTTVSHAEALAYWFNQKNGVAVCGVGGKSTISAMICWILEKAQTHPSYAIGVGDIIGLGRTGKWDEIGEVFVAEADEYATDPVAVQQGVPLIPRFTYLQPSIAVSSTISFDHPDVYRDEEQTHQVFLNWFRQIRSTGILIASDENRHWLKQTELRTPVLWYGQAKDSDLALTNQPETQNQKNIAQFSFQAQTYTLTLAVPGTYNILNALAAIGATQQLGVPIQDSIRHLTSFQSTKRRFERVGVYNGVDCYDDYAHHPRELSAVIEAAKQWFGKKRLVIAFQPHTFSRTKALFADFVAALSTAPELVLLDIFSSARETADPSISSDQLCDAIRRNQSIPTVQSLHTIDELIRFCRTELQPGDVLLTLGAGDIYTVYQQLGVHHD